MKNKIIVFLVLLMFVFSTFAIAEETDSSVKDPDLQGALKSMEEVMVQKCADELIKEFGINLDEAKDKCKNLIKSGRDLVDRKYEFKDESRVKAKYGREEYDDEYFEDEFDREFEFNRPMMNIGHFMPDIGGMEKEFVKGMIFDKLDEDLDLDLEELMDTHCDDQEQFYNIVKEKVVEVYGNDLSPICDDVKEKSENCEEMIEEHCDFGMHDPMMEEDEEYFEFKYTCPPKKDEFIELCVKRTEWEEKHRDYKIECEDEWFFNEDYFEEECERNSEFMNCDKDDFISECEERKDDEKRWEEEREENERRWEEEQIRWEDEKKEYDNEEHNDGRFCHSDDEIAKLKDDCDAEGGEPELYYDGSDCVKGFFCKHFEEENVPDESSVEEAVQEIEEKVVDAVETTNIDGAIDENTVNTITGNLITGNVIKHKEMSCEEEWERSSQGCEWSEAMCDEDKFIDVCVKQRKEHMEKYVTNAERFCERSVDKEMKFAKRHCERQEEDQKRCREKESEICEGMKKGHEKCMEVISNDEIFDEIKDKISQSCKLRNYFGPAGPDFMKPMDDDGEENIDETLKEVVLALSTDITESEIIELATFVQELQESSKVNNVKIYKGLIEPFALEDIKGLPYVIEAKYNKIRTLHLGQKKGDNKGFVRSSDVENVLKNIFAIRQDSSIPEDFAPILDNQAEELIEVTEDLEKIEESENEKGIGYKLQRFLGMAKEAEEKEIGEIKVNKERLEESISNLEKLLEDIPDISSKATLQSQIDVLNKQKEDLEKLMESKEKKAKGWFSLFFN